MIKMNIRRKSIAGLSLAIVVLGVTEACRGGSGGTSESAGAATEAATLSEPSGDVVTVATADGSVSGNPELPGSARPALAAGDPVTIKVYKDANCGCCNKWVEHLATNGFKVETMDMPDLSLLKQKHGVTDKLQSCHTAIVDGYVVEGHVPADVIRKMLKDRPSIAGLAVPGMPAGSPGMEGDTKERYDILTFDRAGKTGVYATR